MRRFCFFMAPITGALSARPNIVFILADDIGAEKASFFSPKS